MARILVVDDSPEFLNYVTMLLQRAYYSVVAVTDPRDAWDKFNHDKFDLILADINMPGGVSGFDLVKTFRKKRPKLNTPIALISARKEKNDIQMALACGIDDYIVKPVDPQLFLAKVDSLIHKSTGAKNKFAEGYVHENGNWDSEIQILHITEKDMIVLSSLKVPLDTIVKFKSEFFTKLGIQSPALRVIECYEDSTQRGQYFIRGAFIGLTEAELQKIRSWVHTHPAG